MRKLAFIVAFMFFPFLSLFAQADKKEVRRGNSDYRKSNYKEAEIHYRKAVLQDSTSFAAVYDLSNTLYQQKDFDGASNTLSKIEQQAPESRYADRYYFNKGNISLQKKDYKTAVEDFKQALLQNPSDLEAKESYLYAKKMLQNQNGGDQNDQNDQNQQQNQDQGQNDKDEQQNNQDQSRDQQQQGQGDQQQISKSQAQQMLKAIQAQEKETQQKVEKAKAEKAKTRQKDKNW